MRESDCIDFLKANAKSNFFPRTCSSTIKSMINGSRNCSKRNLEMLCLCRKTYSCYDNKFDKFKFSSKGLNNRVLEDSGDGPMSKYRRVLDDAINLTSTNGGLKTSYEQRKGGHI